MRSFPPQLAWVATLWAAGLALLGGCSTPPASATSGVTDVSSPGVVIDHVDHHYMDAANFQRISEYFTGVENKTGRIIERTDPKERAGYYFIVNLAWHPGTVLPAGTQAELDYIRSDSPATRHAKFVFSSATGTWPEICLGLTGADWPVKTSTIVAYKLALEDATGKVLASRQSFLWSLPDTTSPSAEASTTAPAKP
jgi:hypothetical protein